MSRDKMLSFVSELVHPVLGFKDQSAAMQHAGRVYNHRYQARVVSPGTGSHYVVQRQYELPNQTKLLGRVVIGRGTDGENWVELNQGATRPAGSYNTCMLVQGKRMYRGWAPNRADYELAEILRQPHDVYAAWGNASDGSPVVGDDDATFATRSGRAAFYTELRSYSYHHGWMPLTRRVVLVRFQVLDHDSHKPDVVRVRFVATSPCLGENGKLQFRSDTFDERWRPLVDRAHAGWRRTGCQRLPDSLREYYKKLSAARLQHEAERNNSNHLRY